MVIVGVGASAGGLEALTRLFENASPEAQVSFIVVLHLSPDYKSMMVDLLGRRTRMQVKRAEDGVAIAPGTVYVVEPGHKLALRQGRLRSQPVPREQRLDFPIDQFFRSLADELGDKAIAIVLSGTGSDGTRGSRAIGHVGGLVIVQEPTDAAFDGMPMSAISHSNADFVMPAGDIGKRLPDLVARHKETDGHTELGDAIPQVIAALAASAPVDFAKYKAATIGRRIDRRRRLIGADFDSYIAMLRNDADERRALVRDLLINVTSFFRDRDAWHRLEETMRLALGDREGEIRVWVVGCSTGEEAYSLAMVLTQLRRLTAAKWDFRIFATDVDEDALAIASVARYAASIVDDVPTALRAILDRNTDGTYQVPTHLRDRVVVAPHDATRDAPFSGIDLITCRNVLIYLESEVQRALFDRFAFSLRQGGLLWLGASESLDHESFVARDREWCLFERRGPAPAALGALSARRPRTPHVDRARAPGGSVRHADWLALHRSLSQGFVPPHIVVNGRRELLYRSGDLRGLLSLPDGMVSLDIADVLPAGIFTTVTRLLDKLASPAHQAQDLVANDVSVQLGDTAAQCTLRVRRLGAEGELLAGVFFEGLELSDSMQVVTVPAVSGDASELIADLQQQLRAMEHERRDLAENAQTAHEELQATNEELVAANEELQSLNEELQSVNEELRTVNDEYRSKVRELSIAHDQLDRLLALVDVGVVVLDEELNVVRSNQQVQRWLHVTESDVGRPLAHFGHQLRDYSLAERCAAAARSGDADELLVQTKDGGRVLLRIAPAHSGSGSDRIVVTFHDLTSVEAMRSENQLLAEAMRTATVPMVIIDPDRRVLQANDALCTLCDRDPRWLSNLAVSELVHPGDREALQSVISAALSGNSGRISLRPLTPSGQSSASGVYVGSLESAGEIIGAVMVFEEQLAAHDGPLVGVWGYYIYDPAENIALFASRALYDLFGIDEGRLHFSYIHESLVVAADLAALTTALHAALETDSIQLARYRIKRPDGRELSLCSRFNALREGNRALIAGVTWCEGEGP